MSANLIREHVSFAFQLLPYEKQTCLQRSKNEAFQ